MLSAVPGRTRSSELTVIAGGQSTWFTVICVVRVPARAFAARNVTGQVPECEYDVRQVRVPEVLPAVGVNVASWPGGRLERSAVSEVIALPSGSEAVTFTVIVAPS